MAYRAFFLEDFFECAADGRGACGPALDTRVHRIERVRDDGGDGAACEPHAAVVLFFPFFNFPFAIVQCPFRAT